MRTIGFFLVFSIMTSASAKAPVWKVSKGDDYIYLGGTIHLLSQKDYPLPKAFDQAYEAADEVWFEVDIGGLLLPAGQQKMMSVMRYSDQTTLSSILNEETTKALSAYLAERNLQMQLFDKLTPAGMMLTMTTIELQRLGLIDQTAGVDRFYDLRAAQDSIDRFYLEEIDEQLSFIDKFNDLDPNEFLNSMLSDIGRTSEVWKSMLQAWRSGDMQQLAQIGIIEMQKEYPDIYDALLVQRNEQWLPKIKAMFQTDDIEFVLVGSLHMAGEKGLIEKLLEDGYQVRQLD